MMKMNEESLKRQKIIQDNNPMDDENEQSLLRKPNMYQNVQQLQELPGESRFVG